MQRKGCSLKYVLKKAQCSGFEDIGMNEEDQIYGQMEAGGDDRIRFPGPEDGGQGDCSAALFAGG
jgi:hypothetical protein